MPLALVVAKSLGRCNANVFEGRVSGNDQIDSLAQQ